MFEPTKHVTTFFISAFQRYDGALVLDELKPGMNLEMAAMPDNPYDPDAIALYYNKVMLGYVPRNENDLIAQMLRFSHDNVFEARVLQVDPEAEPWNQVRVGIYVVDAR